MVKSLKALRMEGKIIRCLGSMMYIVKGGLFQHRRHINQLRSRNTQNKQPVQFTDGHTLWYLLKYLFCKDEHTSPESDLDLSK